MGLAPPPAAIVSQMIGMWSSTKGLRTSERRLCRMAIGVAPYAVTPCTLR